LPIDSALLKKAKQIKFLPDFENESKFVSKTLALFSQRDKIFANICVSVFILAGKGVEVWKR
jgi:hypothetical protein